MLIDDDDAVNAVNEIIEELDLLDLDYIYKISILFGIPIHFECNDGKVITCCSGK